MRFAQVRRGNRGVTAVTAVKGQHRHESCRDKDCERPFCRVWREAFAEGYGYGFEDGVAACPRDHR